MRVTRREGRNASNRIKGIEEDQEAAGERVKI